MPESPEGRRVHPDRAHDPGLKRLLAYTFIALVLAVLSALVAVALVVYFFDPAQGH